MSSCVVCSRIEPKVSYKVANTGETFFLSNFYGVLANCTAPTVSCFDIPNDDSAIQNRFGGNLQGIRGCFYGHSGTELNYAWYALSNNHVMGNCPDSCMTPSTKSALQRVEGQSSDFVSGCDGGAPKVPVVVTTTTDDLVTLPTNRNIAITPSPPSDGNIGLIAGVSSAAIIVVIAAVIFGVLFVKRRNRQKNVHFESHYPPQQPYNTAPVIGTLPPSALVKVAKELPLLGYTLIPSLNLAKFDEVSEMSALDGVAALNDQIHRFVSTIVSMFPDAVFRSQNILPSSVGDGRSTNMSSLKSFIASVSMNQIYSKFDETYTRKIANTLWESNILQGYRDRSKVDERGVMQVEPETIYYAIFKLVDSTAPKFQNVPDQKVLQFVRQCSGEILQRLGENIGQGEIDDKISEAVFNIAANSAMVVIKLKSTDESYSPYLPFANEPYIQSRMRANGSGRTVLFAETCGWEKKRAEGNIVKIPASVWVE
ncbi:hypothetical protein HK098_002693 [Nowakowskiella sp. JEL0407]|nr:hypothetical protein HK098_002693 [Nowakowskiella sp. JEL0407]